MTSVGTPIYVAPEVMAGDHYDATADSYSFGIYWVAMIRGEKDVTEFYFQALRKTMKRKTKKGVGITILNNRMYSKGWRPLLPLEFERSYLKLCKLLKRCLAQKKEDPPGFDEIVRVMHGEVSDECEEPAITIYCVENGAVFHERMGKEEVFDEEEEEEEGGGGQQTARTITKVAHERLMDETKVAHERLMDELRARIKELEAPTVAVGVETKKVKQTEQDLKVDGELARMTALVG